MDFRRKTNRFPCYDYSENGIYFVTICVEDRSPVFGEIINIDPSRGAYVQLSEEGNLVNSAILRLPEIFNGVKIHNDVIMPNHLHLLIGLNDSTVSLSSIINYFKGYVTRRSKRKIWQKSFYDHIIRDENDFLRIWEYIDNNPGKWSEDRYYVTTVHVCDNS